MIDLHIEECIGKGTFSVVYRVHNVKNKKKYALKKVFLGDIVSQEARNDSFNEVNLLKVTNHPNIVRFVYSEFNHCEGSGILYLVLELASYGDLHQFIQWNLKVPQLIAEKTIWKFTYQLSSALSYLHACRIMHRDIKPANIYLGENEVIKVGDFGFGKFCPDVNELFATSVLGSPYYMSPERLLQKKYYFNSDVWALGCVIYELAALQSPFLVTKLDMNLLIKKVINCDYVPIPCDLYSKELMHIIDLCLTENCKKRPEAKIVSGIASVMMNNLTEH